MGINGVQTFINQIHQEHFTPLSVFEDDLFWDSLTPASNSEPSEDQSVSNNIPSPQTTDLGQGILDDFDIQEFKGHIKG